MLPREFRFGQKLLRCFDKETGHLMFVDYTFSSEEKKHFKVFLQEKKLIKSIDLSGCGLDDEFITDIADILKSSTHPVTKVIANRNQITIVGALNLLVIPSLESLELQENQIGSANDSKQIESNVVVENSIKRIFSLNLFGNPITANGLKQLTDKLGKNVTLIQLNVGRTLVGQDEKSFGRILLQFPQLEELHLANNNFTENEAKTLRTVIPELLKLRVLNLAENPLGEAGIEHIRNALRTIKIETLIFANCMVSSASVVQSTAVSLTAADAKVSPAFTFFDIINGIIQDKSETLRVLDLSGNRMMSSDAVILSPGLKRCTVLESLSLNNCNLNAENINLLAKSINTKNLVHLGIAQNNLSQLTPEMSEIKLLILRIETLNISRCQLGDKGVSILKDWLTNPTKSHLAHLDISQNEITTNGFGNVMFILRKNLKILSLSWKQRGSNTSSEDLSSTIAKILNEHKKAVETQTFLIMQIAVLIRFMRANKDNELKNSILPTFKKMSFLQLKESENIPFIFKIIRYALPQSIEAAATANAKKLMTISDEGSDSTSSSSDDDNGVQDPILILSQNSSAMSNLQNDSDPFVSQELRAKQLGWNCFDIAARLNRDDFVKYALEKKNDIAFRQLLAPEIRHLAPQTLIFMNEKEQNADLLNKRIVELFNIAATLQYDSKENEVGSINQYAATLLASDQKTNPKSAALDRLPPSLQTNEFKNLLNAYMDAEHSARGAIAKERNINQPFRTELSKFTLFLQNEYNLDPAMPVKDMAELLEIDKEKYPVAYAIYSKHKEAIMRAENNLQAFFESTATYEAFVRDYYGCHGWFAFQRSFMGERANTSMIDIAARYLNTQIIIYLKVNNIWEIVYRTAANRSNNIPPIAIAFRNGNHFVRLTSNPNYMNSAKGKIHTAFMKLPKKPIDSEMGATASTTRACQIALADAKKRYDQHEDIVSSVVLSFLFNSVERGPVRAAPLTAASTLTAAAPASGDSKEDVVNLDVDLTRLAAKK